MKYKKFHIQRYKAVVDSDIKIINTPIPLIGVNESGKSSALEAVAYFDYRNDELASTKGWQFRNRYKPEELTFSVTAEVVISASELSSIVDEYVSDKTDNTIEPAEASPASPAPIPATVTSPTVPVAEESTPTKVYTEAELTEAKSIRVTSGVIDITRTFDITNNSKTYSIGENNSEIIQNIAIEIIKQLPRIYYFDDFLETRIPNEVKFPAEYISGSVSVELDEHQKIIEGAFADTFVSNENKISLRDYFMQSDDNTKSTWIKRVNAHVTKRIIDDWNKMQIRRGDVDIKLSEIEIELSLGDTKDSIRININEQFTKKNSKKNVSAVSMPLNERSQGFKWFFNFSARKCFGALGDDTFIYLIDEPGSYLHSGAQSVLLDAIVDLAKRQPVIYSTHSEFLVDPDKVNINDVRVAHKEDHAVQLIPLAEAKTQKHEGALSTLYNALRLRTPLQTISKKKVVVTEGITDYYFWKPIIDIVYLPGLGAGGNKYLLSMAIGASSKYCALFDGDEAGDNGIIQYKKYFGEEESKSWLTYINSDGTPSVLEKLISSNDISRLKQITGASDTKQAITLLFLGKKTKDFWSAIDTETKNNIQSNVTMIASHLGLSLTNVKNGFTL